MQNTTVWCTFMYHNNFKLLLNYKLVKNKLMRHRYFNNVVLEVKKIHFVFLPLNSLRVQLLFPNQLCSVLHTVLNKQASFICWVFELSRTLIFYSLCSHKMRNVDTVYKQEFRAKSSSGNHMQDSVAHGLELTHSRVM